MLNYRRFLAILCTVLATMGFATPSPAAKPVPPSGTISLEEPSGLSTLAFEPWPLYGDVVTFAINFDGTLSSKTRLFVTMFCKQDDVVVYQWSGDVDFAFPLINQDGPGLWWDGGDALCTASLMYREERGRKAELMILDNTSFEVWGSSF